MKKFFFIAYLIIANAFFSHAQQILTQERAWQIVQDSILNGRVNELNVYVADSILPAGSFIKTIYKNEVSPAFDSWFFFIDDEPFESWEHPCRYVFVNIEGGTFVVQSKRRPPFMGKMKTLMEKEIQEEGTDKFDLRRNITSRTTQVDLPAAHDYAVIISGGASPENNYVRYWNDCAAIYSALINVYNYPKEHVYVLISDGTSDGKDRRLNNGTYDSSPLDLDGDGEPDIQYAATRANISKVFDELAEKLTLEDNLFVFTTDHGGQISGTQAYLCLWNYEIMTDEEFSEEVNKVSAKHINICMEQCNSGGFIDDLQSDNRIIVTACKYDETSKAMSNLLYDEFVYHWTSAVAGYTPTGTIVDVDLNRDGFISMYEAFLYAQGHDTRSETPQYSSTPKILGNMLLLSQSLNLSITGPAVICDTGMYYIGGLPDDIDVVWTLEKEKGGGYELQIDSLYKNQCMVSTAYFEGLLKADIYYNNIFIKSLEKTIYARNSNFYGVYEQESCSSSGVVHPAISPSSLRPGNAYFVHQGCNVRIQSQYFKGMDISYSGITPSSFYYDGYVTVTFCLPLGSGGIPFHLMGKGDGGSCSDFDILFFSVTDNGNLANTSLDVKTTSTGFELSIIEEMCSEACFTSVLATGKDDMEWNLEIYNVYSCERVYIGTVKGCRYNIDTTGWSPGIYSIRAIIGEEVYTNKIQVK